MYNIGIDFGGTNIVTGLVSGIKLIDTISFPTQLYTDPGQTIEAIARDIRQLLSQNGVAMEEVVSDRGRSSGNCESGYGQHRVCQ